MVKASPIGAGIYSLLDSFLVSALGWAFWVLLAQFVLPSEIGFATTIISSISLVSGLLGFGFEFNLLKETGKESKSFHTLLFSQAIFHLAIIPILYFILLALYNYSLAPLIPLSIILFLITGLSFITRHALLGKLKSKAVFVIDIIGIALRFAVTIPLSIISFEASGIMIAFIAQQAFVVIASYILVKMEFKLERPHFKHLIFHIKESMVNVPAKYTRLLLPTLSIVITAFFTSDPVQVAGFYMTLMIMIAISGLSYAISIMALPASQRDNKSFFGQSLKFGFIIILPFITVLVAAPTQVLSLINPAYISADNSLVILAIASIPLTLVNNTVMQLNHQNAKRLLAIMGLVEISTFVTLLVVLTPFFGLVGSSIAILIAVSSTIPLILKFVDKISVKLTLRSVGAIAVVALLGMLLQPLVTNFLMTIVLLETIIGCLIIGLRIAKPSDIFALLKSIRTY